MPEYTMAPDSQHVTLLRVVVHEYLNESLTESLVCDIEELHELDALSPKLVKEVTTTLAESYPQLKDDKDIDVAKIKSSDLFHEILYSHGRYLLHVNLLVFAENPTQIIIFHLLRAH